MDKLDKQPIFPTNISKKQANDAGMAAVLILLLIGFFTGNVLYYKIAIPVLIINMTWPMFFYPFAVFWFGFSHLLGTVVSKVLLSIVFFLLVTPVGFLRKLMGKDSMQLKQFKKASQSVMKKRDYEFTAKDMEHPF